MDFAFWRRNKRLPGAADGPSPRSSDDDSGARADVTAGLRARARRRLIGAAALLLAVAVFVPMLLDSEPRPVPDNIPIDIPSEKTPFTPRLSLPPMPPPADTAASSPTEAAPAAPAGGPAEPVKPAGQRPSAADTAEAERARALLQGKGGTESPVPVAKVGSFLVQAAATSNEAAARNLTERLRKAGFTPYTEQVEAKGATLHRVRIGPFATRDEAERARSRLKALGIAGSLVAV